MVVGLTVEEDAVLDLKTIPTIGWYLFLSFFIRCVTISSIPFCLDENDVKVKCSPVGEQESPAMGPIEDEEFELGWLLLSNPNW